MLDYALTFSFVFGRHEASRRCFRVGQGQVYLTLVENLTFSSVVFSRVEDTCVQNRSHCVGLLTSSLYFPNPNRRTDVMSPRTCHAGLSQTNPRCGEDIRYVDISPRPIDLDSKRRQRWPFQSLCRGSRFEVRKDCRKGPKKFRKRTSSQRGTTFDTVTGGVRCAWKKQGSLRRLISLPLRSALPPSTTLIDAWHYHNQNRCIR